MSYAQGAYDADKALEKLYNAILELETPTIVLFYGDHLPFMTNDKGENLLLSTEYFSTDDVNINNIRKHRTKGAIFSNYDIDLEDLNHGTAEEISAQYDKIKEELNKQDSRQ